MKSKLIQLASFIAVLAIMMPACSKGGGTDVEYLAVKLSDSKDNWSIIELSTGKVIAREDFKNKPSVIVDDMFYVQNDKGEYEFYNINDINKQIGDSYQHATYFQNERAIVCKKDEPLMVINTKGETVKTLGESVKVATPFKNGFAQIVNEDGQCGFIDTEGNIVIKMEYDVAADFSEDGYVVVGKKNEDNMTYSVINAKGEKMFSFNSDKYSDVRTGFVGGSMAVVKDDKIVYLDSEGKQMLKVGENKGENEAYGIYNGLTIYANDEGCFGVKNASGEVVIKAKYEAISPNRDGTYLAMKDGKCAIINGEGEQLSADEYKNIIRINPDRFIVKDGNSYSIIDKKGKEIGTETFSEYSYDFDDSPALSNAREVSFSTDNNTSAEPTGNPETDAIALARHIIAIMNSVQTQDDYAKANDKFVTSVKNFEDYYKAKGDEAYLKFQNACNDYEITAEVKEAQDEMMKRINESNNDQVTEAVAEAAPEATYYEESNDGYYTGYVGDGFCEMTISGSSGTYTMEYGGGTRTLHRTSDGVYEAYLKNKFIGTFKGYFNNADGTYTGRFYNPRGASSAFNLSR